MQTQENVKPQDAKSLEMKTCEHCGNVYRLIWLKEGEDYNDFGYRYCPFCGILTDEFANIKIS